MTVSAWLDSIDPGTHRRVKGLRLITAYGIAWMMGSLEGLNLQLPGHASLSASAAGFALWASVSEGQTTRTASSRDLGLLVLSAVIGAAVTSCLALPLGAMGRAGSELPLIIGSFLVGYLKLSGVLGAGLGSQFYIGQLLAYGVGATQNYLAVIGIAGMIAALAAIVPRLLSGPAEHPVFPMSAPPAESIRQVPRLQMGLQAAVAALVIVALNQWFGLEKSAWAITACTYVIAGTASGTMDRVVRRIIGTIIGVPLGLACLPIAAQLPIVIWIFAAIAMVVYAMALPERYDIACGAYAFALIVTLAVNGEKLGHYARFPRLGDPDRRSAWPDRCNDALPTSNDRCALIVSLRICFLGTYDAIARSAIKMSWHAQRAGGSQGGRGTRRVKPCSLSRSLVTSREVIKRFFSSLVSTHSEW
jgi:hypothetical protein